MARSTLPPLDMRDAGATHVSRRPFSLSLLASLRPEQWTKNLIVFAALIFAQRLLDLEAVGLSTAAFAIFCVLSGVVYLVNDLLDQDADRQHPTKRHRPIASGALAPGTAIVWAAGPRRRRGRRRHLAGAGLRAHRRGLSRPVRRLLPLAEARRHPRRAVDRHRLRAARRGRRRRHRRTGQRVAARVHRAAGAGARPGQAARTNSPCWPMAPPATGASSTNTTRISSTR